MSDLVREYEAAAMASYFDAVHVMESPPIPSPEDFFSSDYCDLASEIQVLGAVDTLDLLFRLRGKPGSKALLEVIGVGMGVSVPVANVEGFFLSKIRTFKENREVHSAAVEALAHVKAFEPDKAMRALREHVEKPREIRGDVRVGNGLNAAVEYFKRFQMMIEGGALESKIKTGVPLFEQKINAGIGGGIHKGQIGCIAARPGRGKSSFGFWLIDQAMEADETLKACIFSLEMPAADVGKKFLDSQMARNLASFHTLPSSGQLAAALTGSEKKLKRLCIDDGSPKGYEAMISRAAELSREGVSLFLVDYIQLIDCGDVPAEGLRVAYSDAVRALTEDAKRNDRAWIILSQFGRTAEGRPPSMSDLKETSAIEESCHWIVGLHREALPESGGVGLHPTALQAHVLKNRYGPAGEVWRFEADWKRNDFKREGA